MENQEFVWPWSNNRIQKYPGRNYEDHIENPASSAASGYKYGSKDIVRKIDFVMTDSTAHNLNKAIEEVEKNSYENCFFSIGFISKPVLLLTQTISNILLKCFWICLMTQQNVDFFIIFYFSWCIYS